MLDKLSILYVEDDIDTQELIKDILESYFKDVFIASDGMEGLLLYEKRKPDIVLSDISMPVMNGLDMSEAIKNIDSNQPIALFTAFNEPEFLNRAAKLGIDTYILKPLDEKQFFNSLSYMAMTLEWHYILIV